MTARLIALPLKAILLASLALTPAAQANSVTNGSFETGDFTGWMLSGNTGFTGVDHGTTGFAPGPQSGSFGAFFGPVGSLGFLSQSVATVPGASYNLTFSLASDGLTPNEFQVSWNGNAILDQINLPSFGYTQEGVSNLLATVYVGAGAVPEPTTLLLWGATMTGLALARWRRRQRQLRT